MIPLNPTIDSRQSLRSTRKAARGEESEWPELPIAKGRIADPHVRRLVLARIDALLAARLPKT